MAIVERQIHKIRTGRWEKMEEFEKKSALIEERLGFPPKRRYGYLTGTHPISTYVAEREWDDLVTMQNAVVTLNHDPEAVELFKQYIPEIIETTYVEYLLKLG